MSLLATRPEAKIHVGRTFSGQIAVGDNILQIASVLLSESPPRTPAKPALASCSKSERRVLAVLGAMEGLSVHAPHLAALARLPDPEEALSALRTRGWVLAEGLRCRLAGTLVKDLPKHWELKPWSKRALVFYVRWAERHHAREHHERIAEEADVLLFLLSWAGGAGLWGELLRLGRAMEDALALGGRWGGWEQVLELELRAARALGDRTAVDRVLHQLGTRHLRLGHDNTARAFPSSAITMREARGDTAGARITPHNLSPLPKSVPLHTDAESARGTRRIRRAMTPLICLTVILSGERMRRDELTVASLRSMELQRSSVVDGASAQGLVTLDAPAFSRVEETLSSDRPDSVALPESTRINAGERAENFHVEMNQVLVPIKVIITAFRDEIKRIATLEPVPDRNLGPPTDTVTPPGNGPGSPARTDPATVPEPPAGTVIPPVKPPSTPAGAPPGRVTQSVKDPDSPVPTSQAPVAGAPPGTVTQSSNGPGSPVPIYQPLPVGPTITAGPGLYATHGRMQVTGQGARGGYIQIPRGVQCDRVPGAVTQGGYTLFPGGGFAGRGPIPGGGQIFSGGHGMGIIGGFGGHGMGTTGSFGQGMRSMGSPGGFR
jgi:hypothetical protein